MPQSGAASKLALGVGMLGCAALGAGVYGALLAPDPGVAGWALFASGIVVVAVAFALAPKEPPPVRVGELGVLVGEPEEARRLHWYEITRLHVVGDDLRLESSEGPVLVPLAAHARAAARVLAEAAQRIGARIDVSPKAHERLPRLSDADAARVPAARLQLAGRKCLASGASITFESDARLCENCAALYHQGHVPAACLRCERPLAEGSAARAAS